MAELRTDDHDYGQGYWESYDNGAGYHDSPVWEDLAHIIHELFGIDKLARRDLAGSIRVVDVGCARGYLVKHLRRRGFDAWGLDISSWALHHADQAAASYLRQFDLSTEDDSHFGRAAFDLVCCLETLEHIPEDRVKVALRHLHDLLRPGGLAFLAICVEGHEGWETDPTHVTVRSPEWWADRLYKAGFDLRPGYVHELQRFWMFRWHQGLFVGRRV